ncbi:hypothetical protein MHYP_G00250260 [Metynnis hypsauchen]
MSATTQSNHAAIYNDLTQNPFPRYFFKWNSSSQTQDLLVRNVSESDLGLYYCALHEKKVGGDDVCYASLDLPRREQKRLKKRVESSDFSTYSEGAHPRYSFESNQYNKTYNLLLKNVTESDLGLYFCARQETKIISDGAGDIRISGAEVEMRVRPGDDITLYSNCVQKARSRLLWFRNFKHQDRPHLILTMKNVKNDPFLCYSFVLNPRTKSHDLLVRNATDSDLGMYYWALDDITKKTEFKSSKHQLLKQETHSETLQLRAHQTTVY